jgi:hypothetical protein
MKALYTLLFLFVSLSLYSQDLAELDNRNGFKEIKLGYPIDSVKGLVFKKDIIERKEFRPKCTKPSILIIC